MATINKLDTLSGRLFLSAVLTSKLSKLPIPTFNHILYIVAMLLYLAAYTIWNASVHEYEKERWNLQHVQTEEFDKLFQHNRYYEFTAISGILASIFSLVAIAFPVFELVSACLFFISNISWSKAEITTLGRLKKEEAPNSPLIAAQKEYYRYTRYATAVTFLTPVMLVLNMIFPPAAPAITLVMSIFIIGLSCHAFKKWFDSGDAFAKIPNRVSNLDRVRQAGDDSNHASYGRMLHHMPLNETALAPNDPQRVESPTDIPEEKSQILPSSTGFSYNPSSC